MAKKTEDFNYRAVTEELERIVAALQDPDIPIDEATKLHTTGLKLVEELETYLNQAEIMVKKHISSSE